MPTRKTPSTPRSRPSAFPASSLLLLAAGCGGSDGSQAAPFCEIPCVVEFFAAAKECADIDGPCSGIDCYPNGARTYAEAFELHAPDGSLCLKRWSTATGLAWQTGEQRLRLDSATREVTCADASSHGSAESDEGGPSACDPIDEPGRACGSMFCEEAPAICPAEGCLCRESDCAAAFFASVRACAGLVGGESCAIDVAAGEACYENGARVVEDEEATYRALYPPGDDTPCLGVTLGTVTFPQRSYAARLGQVLLVDDTGAVVTCPDGTTQSGCGSATPENLDDACDPTAIAASGGCCAAEACDP